ncbi:hypothetical protein RBB77_19925 [Tunturibacter psychrotolerans]|uniref:Uncharacterized protein n=1 Tax=Tunturiibacter psychrotolerans TaxID=3069686 RepID=A0AAU7ZXD8_9BACT
MILLRSSGAFSGMHAKLANGQNQHNWLANALMGDALYETKFQEIDFSDGLSNSGLAVRRYSEGRAENPA